MPLLLEILCMHNIITIDTAFQRPQFDASHLIVENGRGAFVDVGTNYSVPLLLAALAKAELAPEQVDWVLLTHVHLDHAGGAGLLLEYLPNARLVVHPRGARHMIDPAALIAGASSVYGDDVVKATYGKLVPVPKERVVEATDGLVVDLAGRPLLILDTPGHARHHVCIWDEKSSSFFTGDTFGLSYREFDTDKGAFILVSSTPVQFDPDALRGSIARLMSYCPQAMYLTHYSRVEGVERLAEELGTQIAAMIAIARAASGQDQHEQITRALGRLYMERARLHGCEMGEDEVMRLLAMDIELNAQGLEVWLANSTKQH
jgi:glyoxylase-like metal-dependent hydrolase (beta-lactamase superfamily II)